MNTYERAVTQAPITGSLHGRSFQQNIKWNSDKSYENMLYEVITENMQVALDVFRASHEMLQILYGKNLEAKLTEASVCIHALEQRYETMRQVQNEHRQLLELACISSQGHNVRAHIEPDKTTKRKHNYKSAGLVLKKNRVCDFFTRKEISIKPFKAH